MFFDQINLPMWFHKIVFKLEHIHPLIIFLPSIIILIVLLMADRSRHTTLDRSHVIKSVVCGISLGCVFFSLSGQMFNRIRRNPFVYKATHQASYIHKGRRFQLQLETYMVFSLMSTLCGFMVFANASVARGDTKKWYGAITGFLVVACCFAEILRIKQLPW